MLCQKRRFFCFFSNFLLFSPCAQAIFDISTNRFLFLKECVLISTPSKSWAKIFKIECARSFCSSLICFSLSFLLHFHQEKWGCRPAHPTFSSFELAHTPPLRCIVVPLFFVPIFISSVLLEFLSVFLAICSNLPLFSSRFYWSSPFYFCSLPSLRAWWSCFRAFLPILSLSLPCALSWLSLIVRFLRFSNFPLCRHGCF